MDPKRNQLAYQEAAVRNASAIELVIVLYDILARDLHAAIEAMEAGNIELRTAKVKHGLLALQQLEGTLNLEEGAELATNLSRFYSMLRSRMMKAQIEQDAGILQELVQLLFNVREAWVELSGRLDGIPAAARAQSAPREPEEAPGAGQLHAASWKA